MYCLDVSDSLLLSLKEIRISERLLTLLTIITWALLCIVQYLILLGGADLWKNSFQEINDDKKSISIGIIQDPLYCVPQGPQC